MAGRRPVEEAFVARRQAHRLLVVPQRREALEALVLHATALRIPVVEVDGGTLTALAGFDGHQGVALVVAPRRWASLDEVLSAAVRSGEPPFVLVLDSLEDPQNLGTLLRSAEACGVHGVIFPTRNAAPLTPAAIKASAGAVEHLLMAPVDDLPGTLVDLRARGMHVVGTDAEAALSYRDADLRGPLALVVGSEGHGLGGTVRRRLELMVRIPMRGRVGSLNAAVAGSVLLFEAAAQRLPGSTGGEPAGPAAEASATEATIPGAGATEPATDVLPAAVSPTDGVAVPAESAAAEAAGAERAVRTSGGTRPRRARTAAGAASQPPAATEAATGQVAGTGAPSGAGTGAGMAADPATDAVGEPGVVSRPRRRTPARSRGATAADAPGGPDAAPPAGIDPAGIDPADDLLPTS